MLKEHQSLLDNIKLAILKTNQKTIWNYLKGKDDKRTFVLESEKMPFVSSNNNVTEIKKLADDLEQPSRKGFISLPLLNFALEETGLEDAKLSKLKAFGGQNIVDAREDVSSILKDNNLRPKKSVLLVGEREFTEAQIKKIKQLVNEINSFIEEDGLKFKEVFEQYDKTKSGLVTYSQFDDILYNDLGVELDDPAIATQLKLTKEFGTRVDSKDEIDYMKLKDLIDGKLEKKVVFNLSEEAGPNRGSAINPNANSEIQNEDAASEKTNLELLDKLTTFYRTKNLTKNQFFFKFSKKNADNVEGLMFTQVVMKDVVDMKKEELKVTQLYKYLLEKQNEHQEKKIDVLTKDFFISKFTRAFIDPTPVKMDGNFDQQVEQVFNLVDINQNGAINKQELKLGCKKLGLNLNDDEISNLFESFKAKDGSQNLNKKEFIDLIGYEFRNELIKPATVIDRLKTEIQIIDIDGTGYLNGDQITNLYTRMGLTVTEEEVKSIIVEIGDQKTSEVQEDKLIHAVIGKDQKFSSQHMNKAMIKLRGASSPTLGEYINSFANMPENYFLSFSETLLLYGRNLPSSAVAPILSGSGFYYTNLFQPNKTTNANDKASELKLYQNINLSSHIRVTVPNFLVKLNFSRAIGIPLPSQETLENAKICSRSLRILLLKNKEYICNLAEVPVRYNPSYEDRWYFDSVEDVEVKLDMDSHQKDQLGILSVFGGMSNSNQVLIKKDQYNVSLDVGLEVVFELVIAIKRKECKNEIIMSNGYAKVKLADLQKQSSFSLEVNGGDPVQNELRINPDEIRKGRHGFMASFLGIFEGKVAPKLEFGVSQKFSDEEKQRIGVLPDTCIVAFNDLLMQSLFRQCLGYEAFKFPNMTNTDVHNLLSVKTFQYLYNIYSVKTVWNEFFNLSIYPYLKDYNIGQLNPIFTKMMKKIYLMLCENDFYFSKDFQTREYAGNRAVQLSRLKLCRKYFREIFTMVLKEIQLTDQSSKIVRKYKCKFSFQCIYVFSSQKFYNK